MPFFSLSPAQTKSACGGAGVGAAAGPAPRGLRHGRSAGAARATRPAPAPREGVLGSTFHVSFEIGHTQPPARSIQRRAPRIHRAVSSIFCASVPAIAEPFSPGTTAASPKPAISEWHPVRHLLERGCRGETAAAGTNAWARDTAGVADAVTSAEASANTARVRLGFDIPRLLRGRSRSLGQDRREPRGLHRSGSGRDSFRGAYQRPPGPVAGALLPSRSPRGIASSRGRVVVEESKQAVVGEGQPGRG